MSNRLGVGLSIVASQFKGDLKLNVQGQGTLDALIADGTEGSSESQAMIRYLLPALTQIPRDESRALLEGRIGVRKDGSVGIRPAVSGRKNSTLKI